MVQNWPNVGFYGWMATSGVVEIGCKIATLNSKQVSNSLDSKGFFVCHARKAWLKVDIDNHLSVWRTFYHSLLKMTNFREWTLFHISLFVTFVVSGLIINLIQASLFFTVGQVSRKFFRKINFYFNWIINAQVHISLMENLFKSMTLERGSAISISRKA
jgi:hypothetical protein